MKLTNAAQAEIPKAKIVNYLLCSTHHRGKSKAAFFTTFGFNAKRWEEMATALRQHALDNDVTETEETPFGTRYVVDGMFNAPDGSRLNVRSAWFMDRQSDAARFATAHPLKRRKA